MLSAVPYFWVAALCVSVGALLFGAGALLSSREIQEGIGRRLPRWLYIAAAGVLVFGTGFFAMALNLVLRVRLSW